MCERDYPDDPTIGDAERLFRRVHITFLVPDDDTGLARISSGAFRDKDLSINIESILLSEGKTPAACLATQTTHKLTFISAGAARQHQQSVCRDPDPLHDNLSHGIVWGPKNKNVRDGLRDSAHWVIPAQAPPYPDVLAEKQALGLG
jgi:hypothetical protein